MRKNSISSVPDNSGDGRRPIKHAANGLEAVTKTPPKFALQNPANPGLPDSVFGVLKDTSENHRRQITKTLNRRFTRFS